MKTNAPERWPEDFELCLDTENDLLAEVDVMEQNSVWLDGNISKDLALIGIPSPMEAITLAQNLNLEPERTRENADGFVCHGKARDGKNGATGLVLSYQSADVKSYPFLAYKNVSRAAWGTLCETAKLNGAALSRMAPLQLAECLNKGLDVARGSTLLLIRHDKVMAMHSDSKSGYCVMPISELLHSSRGVLESRFGAVCFRDAYHSNVLTSALWTLPDAQSEMIDKYRTALRRSASHVHAINFMPAVRFTASDTARSSATLRPMFLKPDGTAITFGGEIAVKHEKRKSGKQGVKLFEEEAGQLFARFDETMEVIETMGRTEIYNPVNCVVGLFNAINRGSWAIKRQFADAAREEVERLAISAPVMSMHDIFLSLYESVSAAKASGITNTLRMEEAIAKVLTLNWKDYDVGGLVAWGEKGAA